MGTFDSLIILGMPEWLFCEGQEKNYKIMKHVHQVFNILKWYVF